MTGIVNIYGFRRVTEGINAGSYANPYFVRGKADICCFMNRTKIKKKGFRSDKTKTKFMKAVVPFEKSNNSTDGIVVANETSLSNLLSKHDVNSDGDSLSTCSSTELRSTLLHQNKTSLYVLPCDEFKTNRTRTTIVDTITDNQNKSSSMQALPLYQTTQKLRKMFPQPQRFVDHLQQKQQVEQGGLCLNARKRSNTAMMKQNHDPQPSTTSPNKFIPCAIDFELDLDTIFDDN
jgi:hypothetical protein